MYCLEWDAMFLWDDLKKKKQYYKPVNLAESARFE